MQEFILLKGDIHILPYLNKADKQRISHGKLIFASLNHNLVCHGWNNMVSSESIFKSIFTCVKDVA